MTKDPVCGSRIHRGKARAIVEYEHVLYFFCCPRCQAEFEARPNHFANPAFGVKAKVGAR